MPIDDCVPHCPIYDCTWIFSRIRIMHQVRGGTRIEYTLHPKISDRGPYYFQLQVGRTGINEADDWINVGLPVVNSFYLIDDTQRVFGKTLWSHYRIQLSTPNGLYYSAPQHVLGDLTFKDWRRYQALYKFQKLLFRQESGQEGYLLKRRLYGPICTVCNLDYQTEEVLNAQCLSCYGTGFENGYYDPVPCIFAELTTKKRREHLDGGQARGTINDLTVVRGKFLASPLLDEEDVWVHRSSDRRWYIHEITNEIELRGVPVLVNAELRLAPFTDGIYSLEIPGQVPN